MKDESVVEEQSSEPSPLRSGARTNQDPRFQLVATENRLSLLEPEVEVMPGPLANLSCVGRLGFGVRRAPSLNSFDSAGGVKAFAQTHFMKERSVRVKT